MQAMLQIMEGHVWLKFEIAHQQISGSGLVPLRAFKWYAIWLHAIRYAIALKLLQGILFLCNAVLCTQKRVHLGSK